MSEVVGILAALLGVAIGGTLHELTHYVVLRAFGVNATFRLPRLEGRKLKPGVEFEVASEVAPRPVRVAAAAPLPVGLMLAAVGASLLPPSPEVFAGLVSAVVFCATLSRSDIQTARGRVVAA